MTQTHFSDEQLQQLRAKLSTTAIRERKGGNNKMLKYIKGDYAIDTANKIFGFGQWGYRVVARSREAVRDDKKGTIEYYSCDVELSVVGAAFTFPGSGVGIVTAPYTVEMHEKARKEAETDALKRALRHYGDQFGLSLYDEDDYLENPDGTITQVKNAHPVQQTQQSQRVVSAAPTRPQLASPQPAMATLQQLSSIDKLCEVLQKPAPPHVGMTFEDAKELIRKLTAEYKDVQEMEKQKRQGLPPLPAQSEAIRKMIANAKARAGSLQVLWEDAKTDANLRNVADEALTVQQVAQINGVLSEYAKKVPVAAK